MTNVKTDTPAPTTSADQEIKPETQTEKTHGPEVSMILPDGTDLNALGHEESPEVGVWNVPKDEPLDACKLDEARPTRVSILNRAMTKITQERQEEYGDPQVNLGRVADMWTATLGIRVTEKMVALLLAQLKIARLAFDPENMDSWEDLIGYAALGAELHETGLKRVSY